ncbi:hypothetical protein ACFX2I_027166 [Malus domestica]
MISGFGRWTRAPHKSKHKLTSAARYLSTAKRFTGALTPTRSVYFLDLRNQAILPPPPEIDDQLYATWTQTSRPSACLCHGNYRVVQYPLYQGVSSTSRPSGCWRWNGMGE